MQKKWDPKWIWIVRKTLSQRMERRGDPIPEDGCGALFKRIERRGALFQRIERRGDPVLEDGEEERSYSLMKQFKYYFEYYSKV